MRIFVKMGNEMADLEKTDEIINRAFELAGLRPIGGREFMGENGLRIEYFYHGPSADDWLSTDYNKMTIRYTTRYRYFYKNIFLKNITTKKVLKVLRAMVSTYNKGEE